jgi:hypothetical protein
MAQQPVACHRCKHVWTTETALGRRDECPSCHSDAKVCLNCRHFDRGAHHECREEQAEWVKEKDRGNFCSYFEPSGAVSAAASEAAKARSKLDGLFGGPKPEETSKPAASFQDELKKFLESKKR